MANAKKLSGSDVNNSLVLGAEPSGVSLDQAFDIMMSDKANLESLSSEYFKFDKIGRAHV